jgi:hypothetical protein
VYDYLTRKGQPHYEKVLGIGRLSGRSCCDDFSNERFLYCPLSNKTVVGFLKLVELYKGLVVGHCLISTIEMNGKS